jgi:hypothetical protein
MTSLPPDAAGASPTYPANTPRPFPQVRPSSAPIELTLDLSATPADKVLPRLLGALERVSADVTLYVLLRDTPEYVGVAASVYQTLRSRGYVSDSARMPHGGQRIRVQRRREPPRSSFQDSQAIEATYAPAPDVSPAETGDRDEPAASIDGTQPTETAPSAGAVEGQG